MSARADAVDAQLALVKYWQDPERALGLAGTIACFVHQPSDKTEKELFAWLDETAPQYLIVMAVSTRNAETYSVSSEMARFLSYAQQDFPEHPLLFEDVPGISGFLYFEEPMEFEINDEAIAVRSIHWCQLSFNEETVDPNKDAAVFLSFLVDGAKEPYAFSMAEFGRPAADTPQRTIQAFWTLSQQRIALTERRRVQRQTRRRAGRAGVDIPEDGIWEVTLRRPEPRHSKGTQLVDWSHRWIVSGHWRNHWFPSQEMHKPKWIEEYQKGPEDKPLMFKRRVFRWRR